MNTQNETNQKHENENETCETLQTKLNSYLQSFKQYNIEKTNFEEKKRKLEKMKMKTKTNDFENHLTLEEILHNDPFFFS